MALEQQNEKVPQERTIEDKINDPKTSWGELTKIRDQLQKDIKDGETELKQLEIGISTLLQSAGNSQSNVMAILDDPRMESMQGEKTEHIESLYANRNLLKKVQARINKEEPPKNRETRKTVEIINKTNNDLNALEKEIIQDDPLASIIIEISNDRISVSRLQEIKKDLEQQKVDYIRQSQDVTSGRVQNREDNSPAPAYVQKAIEMLPKIQQLLDEINVRLDKKE